MYLNFFGSRKNNGIFFHEGGHDHSNEDFAALVDFANLHFFSTPNKLTFDKILPEVENGDKRIILLNGEPVGCLNRIPAKGEFRSNLGVGGIPQLSELTQSDMRICKAIKPILKEMNLVFVGIDVIGKYLTEINVTCPTGVRQIKNLGGSDIPEMFWKYVEGLK